MIARVTKADKMIAAAGGFTGLWALTWLGTSMMAAGSVAQGAFGLGAAVSGGGLTALWWKTRAVGQYHTAGEDTNDREPPRTQKG